MAAALLLLHEHKWVQLDQQGQQVLCEEAHRGFEQVLGGLGERALLVRGRVCERAHVDRVEAVAGRLAERTGARVERLPVDGVVHSEDTVAPRDALGVDVAHGV